MSALPTKNFNKFNIFIVYWKKRGENGWVVEFRAIRPPADVDFKGEMLPSSENVPKSAPSPKITLSFHISNEDTTLHYFLNLLRQ